MDPRLSTLGLSDYLQSTQPYSSQYYDPDLTNGSVDATTQFVQDGGYFQNVPQDELRRHNTSTSTGPSSVSRQHAQSQQRQTSLPSSHSNMSPMTQSGPFRTSMIDPFRTKGVGVGVSTNPYSPTALSSHTTNPYSPLPQEHKQQRHQHQNSTTSLPTPPSDSSTTNARTASNGIRGISFVGPPRPSSFQSPVANTSPTSITASANTSKPGPGSDPLQTLTKFQPPSQSGRPLVPNPPNLERWRHKFFNITSPIILTSDEYHTYFPHIDNVYSHRSTQRYKRKPFVSHYWDCRLKGRPTGVPLGKKKKPEELDANADADADADATGKKKRKRKVRERDLCDVKIKVTEHFGRDELEALIRAGQTFEGFALNESAGDGAEDGSLTFVMDEQQGQHAGTGAGAGAGTAGGDGPFGMLEPLQNFPPGHPGATGERWYMIQRVSGNDREADGGEYEGKDLDHKHTLEESDRIKKNSVQRWLLAQQKEKKKLARAKGDADDDSSDSPQKLLTPASRFRSTGNAAETKKLHAQPAPSQITFIGNAFCPFSQRIWITLEYIGIPYQYIEITESQFCNGRCIHPELADVNPEGIIPCIRHGNFCVWESNVVMEYLEDLAMGHSLFPVGNAQLKAHSRLWTDHINRKILPAFYSLLLTPQPAVDKQWTYKPGIPNLDERRLLMVTTLQEAITKLVNASHRTGPFFLGEQMSYVDVAFAPWILRLSRVLSYYRDFPQPEVGTRWQSWVDAVERHPEIQGTLSEDKSYHDVYGGVGEDSFDGTIDGRKMFAEIGYAQRLVRQEGFGLGGDIWGHIRNEMNPQSVV